MSEPMALREAIRIVSNFVDTPKKGSDLEIALTTLGVLRAVITCEGEDEINAAIREYWLNHT